LFSRDAARLTVGLGRALGRRQGLNFVSELLSPATSWFETRFVGTEVADLYGPWALHTGLSPDTAGSRFQTLAIAGALHGEGNPVVRGGSANFVHAFDRLISDHGGHVRVNAQADKILLSGGAAVGVIAGDEEIRARRAVIANTTPTQLYGRLLPKDAAPIEAARQASAFRYNARAGMQIHLSLKEPLRWRDRRLDRVPIVHVSGDANSVCLACAQASAGLLPAEPTVVVGQPAIVDPSRVPEGAGVIWIQLQQVPYSPTGDAAREIDTAHGEWSSELTQEYAERILSSVGQHVSNWPAARGTMVVLPPPELERRNPNLVRGDIYAGDCSLGQSYLWRPLPGFGSHATPIDRLYHCGASTYPGPGLNAASGRIVAKKILTSPGALRRAARFVRKAPK
jgi:phytoene dehydrogenase-like protein